jgi:hypothetical protein
MKRCTGTGTFPEGKKYVGTAKIVVTVVNTRLRISVGLLFYIPLSGTGSLLESNIVPVFQIQTFR